MRRVQEADLDGGCQHICIDEGIAAVGNQIGNGIQQFACFGKQLLFACLHARVACHIGQTQQTLRNGAISDSARFNQLGRRCCMMRFGMANESVRDARAGAAQFSRRRARRATRPRLKNTDHTCFPLAVRSGYDFFLGQRFTTRITANQAKNR